MTNPYSAPESNLEIETKITKSIPVTIIFSIIAPIMLYLIVYYPVGIIIRKVIHPNNASLGFIIDSVATFLVLFIYFYLLSRIKIIYPVIVILCCATGLTGYWLIQSQLHKYGFNRAGYPVWYAVNIAVNDFVAAFLIIIVIWLKNRKVKNID
ncbi:MAG: hypothetical protein D6B27_01320 [Gammaproteobacteria bacterium]|nr:MAG: hypothetical protein D6B27_01320 [Gammaproteobacteria bacterium]